MAAVASAESAAEPVPEESVALVESAVPEDPAALAVSVALAELENPAAVVVSVAELEDQTALAVARLNPAESVEWAAAVPVPARCPATALADGMSHPDRAPAGAPSEEAVPAAVPHGPAAPGEAAA